MPTVTEARHGVHVLDLGDGDNRFTPEWTQQVASLLERVERLPRPVALVTTATGKIWCNGLDLEWMLATPSRADAVLRDVQTLMARFLTSPVYCVAALQGHAFAAGAMLALAHDTRIMRSDRGFWCLPEIDIDIPFTAGMSALITAKLPPATAHEAMLTGRRYGAAEALAKGIIDGVEVESALLDAAIGAASTQSGRAGATLGAIKRDMYGAAYQSLRDGPAHLAAAAAV